MGANYYAHSKQGRPPPEWQPLKEHLKNVAELAKKFAEYFIRRLRTSVALIDSVPDKEI